MPVWEASATSAFLPDDYCVTRVKVVDVDVARCSASSKALGPDDSPFPKHSSGIPSSRNPPFLCALHLPPLFMTYLSSPQIILVLIPELS